MNIAYLCRALKNKSKRYFKDGFRLSLWLQKQKQERENDHVGIRSQSHQFINLTNINYLSYLARIGFSISSELFFRFLWKTYRVKSF